MQNRTVTFILISIIVLFFAGYYIALNTTLNTQRSATEMLTDIISAAKDDDWDKATNVNTELKTIWKKVEYLILLNYGETDYSNFEQTIEKLSSAIEQKEKYETVQNASCALHLWPSFTKVVPKH